MSSSASSYLGRPTYFLMALVLLLTVLCVTFPAYLRNPADAIGCFTGAVAPLAAADEEEDRRPPELSILVGVHTMAKKHSRRHLIRMAYALQQTPALRGAARVDVRFALCARPMTPEQRAFVALESQAYGDVLLFNCTESAEGGKTYDYFAGLPAMMLGGGGDGDVDVRPYDYVMKVDDDTYLRLDALVETLRRAPREDMYYGVGLPFMNRKSPPFMLGMGYVLSWDLVQWIATSDMVRSEAKGVEDVTTGNWLNMGNKAKNRVNIFPRMYDYKSAQAKDFLVDTIGVHQLKEDIRWAHTLEHFNATQLDPSTMLQEPTAF
ncbi:beta-1,3-galactosyltransferase 6-like [Lolium rigidum]|uniref:beta-1,3-galactosyltransferase 6-like n=1 Tax=Lolium rigidum TaxID=89674 RepID=UPI001F5C54A4|nr:beta-1,3-galactosyltransferase 6-like [Lolium rigidum]